MAAFVVLYTHQKTKMRKVWQDGTLTLSRDGRNADLRDSDRNILASIYVRKEINAGDELESPRYLIQIEEACAASASQEVKTEIPESKSLVSNGNLAYQDKKAVTHSGVCVDGPKRKRYKFTAPRRVGPAPAANFESTTVKPPVNYGQSIWTRNVQDTQTKSPRFEMPSQQRGEELCSKAVKKIRTTEEVLAMLNQVKNVAPSPTTMHVSGQTDDKVENSANKQTLLDRADTQRGGAEESFRSPVIAQTIQTRLSKELFFPMLQDLEVTKSPQRSCEIPIRFSSVENYVKALVSVLQEHLNLILWQASDKYHSFLTSADVSGYAKRFSWQYDSPSDPISELLQEIENEKQVAPSPSCHHGVTAKSVMVNKEGKNKGRFFYACSLPRAKQCKFFKWQEDKATGDFKPSAWGSMQTKTKLNNARAVTSFMKRNGIDCYCECVFRRKIPDAFVPGTKVKVPEWIRRARGDLDDLSFAKKKIYLLLPRKERSSTYGKDDIWVISQSLNFFPEETFIARSSFYGPSAASELEIQPLSGYCSTKWNDGDIAYALLVYNAATELSCIRNLQDNLSPRKFPLLPHILDVNEQGSSGLSLAGLHRPHHVSAVKHQTPQKLLDVDYEVALSLANKYVEKYQLNDDQASALCSLVDILCGNGKKDSPILLVHGVFGSGKSFLLAIMVVFMQELACPAGKPFKVLLSSATNVAVDRVLLCLLDLGYSSFCRVGSIKKIASRVLPYSVHNTDNEHIKELQHMLANPDLSHEQKLYIRKSLEQVRLGTTKTLLKKSLLVGATCAASTFACLQPFTFPLIILDECTQCTEPLSLLPLSNFGCRGLLLVGDPNQLSPTVEGAKASHDRGLEQTMFDRLSEMGHCPVMLRTQYRCHPSIGDLVGHQFYHGHIRNGVMEDQRPRLIQKLPNVMFYDISDGKEERDASGSFRNNREANFVSEIIKLLLSHGVPGAEIGIIALYKSQVEEITMSLQDIRYHDLSDVSSILVSTVDAFQGAEKSVIILSCVRTTHSSFAESSKRMCVALTRARNHLLLVGHRRCLSASSNWQRVIDSCKDCIQTPFQFRKLWGKKLELASSKEDCIAQPPPFQQYKHMSKVRQSDLVEGSTEAASLSTEDCSMLTPGVSKHLVPRSNSPLFDLGADFISPCKPGDGFSPIKDLEESFGIKCENMAAVEEDITEIKQAEVPSQQEDIDACPVDPFQFQEQSEVEFEEA